MRIFKIYIVYYVKLLMLNSSSSNTRKCVFEGKNVGLVASGQILLGFL